MVSVCPLMPSHNTYHLTWVSFTLDVGYLFTALPAKHSCCSLPWTRGISSPPDPEHGVAPLSPPVPVQPPLLGHGVSPRGIIHILEIVDVSPAYIDSSLNFVQPSISHDVLSISVKQTGWQPTALLYSFLKFEPVSCSMQSSNCCFLNCIQVCQETG